MLNILHYHSSFKIEGYFDLLRSYGHSANSLMQMGYTFSMAGKSVKWYSKL